jgi:hypothetical protein
LKQGKAPAVDLVTTEEIVATGEIGIDIMFALCSKRWKEEKIADQWMQSVIVPIYKKG